jgi:hypothetical protein
MINGPWEKKQHKEPSVPPALHLLQAKKQLEKGKLYHATIILYKCSNFC